MSKKKKAPAKPGQKLIAKNKQAHRLYEIVEKIEAGISLRGCEVKSLREGRVTLKEGYVRFKDGEAWLVGVHIAPYENTGPYDQPEPERDRRLLLHGHEIRTLQAKVEQKGLTVVPVRMYFARGKVKVEIGLGKGKDVHSKRETIKARDIERDTARQLAAYK